MKKVLRYLLFVVILVSLVGCKKNNPNKLSDISMIIKDNTLTDTSATVIITDLSGDENVYKEWFRIDRKENGKWKELDLKTENNWFDLVSYTVDDNNKLELNQSWESLYGRLDSGEYRLVKEVNNKYFSVEFIIN